MSGDRRPRVGDDVEVRLPGTVVRDGVDIAVRLPIWNGVRVSRDDVTRVGGAVVVTRPVDHPSRDAPGTVRAGRGRVWVKVASGEDGAYAGTWWDLVTHEEVGNDDVEDYPVVHEALVPLVRSQVELARKDA